MRSVTGRVGAAADLIRQSLLLDNSLPFSQTLLADQIEQTFEPGRVARLSVSYVNGTGIETGLYDKSRHHKTSGRVTPTDDEGY